MSENSGVNIVGLPTIDWRTEIAAIAGSYLDTDTRESWLARAARKAKVTAWHAKALFYGELKDPKYSVAHKVLSASAKARIDAARLDAQTLSTKFETIARGMQIANQDLFSEETAALLDAARLLRGVARP